MDRNVSSTASTSSGGLQDVPELQPRSRSITVAELYRPKQEDGDIRRKLLEQMEPLATSRVSPFSMKPSPLFDESANTFEAKGENVGFASLLKRSTGSFSLLPPVEADKEVVEKKSEPKLSLSVFLGSRCTRVHFVRHAEGHHNVVTRNAAVQAHQIADQAGQAALQDALAKGISAQEAAEIAKGIRTHTLREEENRPVHFATLGAEQYTDATLTTAGQNQCYALRGKIDRNQLVSPLDRLHIDLVITSPLRRCLETADIIFGPCKTKARPDLLPFMVHDMCRERYGEFYCDRRMPMSETQPDPSYSGFDWETQKQGWPSHIMPFTDGDEAWQPEREPEEHVLARALNFLQWLSARPEREVAVVTHSSFLKNLFKVFGGVSSQTDQDVLRALPANCELRTVVLCHHG